MQNTLVRHVDKRGNERKSFVRSTVQAARQVKTLYTTAKIIAKAAYMFCEV